MPYRFGQPWTPVWQGAGLLPAYGAQPPLPGALGQGSIAPVHPTAPQIVMNRVTGALAPYVGPVMTNKVANLVDWSPVGSAAQGYQGGADMRHGHWLSGAYNAGSALLSWLPGGNVEANSLRKLF